MKKNILLLSFAIMSISIMGQYYETEFSISQIDGVLLNYECTGQYIASTKATNPFFTFYHTGYLAIVGPMDVWSSNGGSSGEGYGAIGLVLGTPVLDFTQTLKPGMNYYTKDGDRIIDFTGKPLGVIGGRVRVMDPLSSGSSFFSTYWFLDLEYLYYRFDATIQKGAFGHYYYSNDKIGINTVNLNVGIKFGIFKLSAGLGGAFDLYTKGKTYDSPDDTEVKGNPKKTNHFGANVSAGLVFDLF